MRMNKKKKTEIRLRFPEFTDNKWIKTKLLNISSIVKEKAGENKYLLMSVTSGVGLVPQTEKFGREIAGDSYKNYTVIRRYDFAYNKSATKQFPEGFISMLSDYDVAAVPNSIFICFRITDNECYPLFLNYLFYNNYHGKWLKRYIEVGARAHGALSMDTEHLWDMPIDLPCLKEQQKIANCIFSVSKLIDAESRKLRALKKYKKGLMQKLFPAEGMDVPEWRFPEFRDCGAWVECSVGDILKPVTPPQKIVKSEYKVSGKYPIIDQSQEYISGWTDDEASVVFNDSPLIVFGDHTCVLKLVKQPFAQGADGVKILSVDDKLDEEFVYYDLESISIKADGYKRHYSILKKMSVKYSDKNSGEQQKIADCFSKIDSLIIAQSNKIKSLQTHRKGMMQGFFPFPEEAEL